MAVGDETIGFGGTLEINDGASDAFQAVPKIVTLGVPSYVVGTVESKRLDLTNRVIKKLKTLVNGGSFSFMVQHTNATYTRLVAVRDNLVKEYQFRVTVPDDDDDVVITVPGILTEAKIEDLDAEKITVIACTVEVSGDDS